MRVTKKLAVERPMLKSLPTRRTAEYEELPARVSKYAIFTVKGAQYSAPSQLIGHRLSDQRRNAVVQPARRRPYFSRFTSGKTQIENTRNTPRAIVIRVGHCRPLECSYRAANPEMASITSEPSNLT